MGDPTEAALKVLVEKIGVTLLSDAFLNSPDVKCEAIHTTEGKVVLRANVFWVGGNGPLDSSTLRERL